jgi:hypothetical protein
MTGPIVRSDLIGNIFENPGKIIAYVEEHRLVEVAGAVWHLSTPLQRRVMLQHLVAEVRSDKSPYRRFFAVRDELDAYDSDDEFVDLLATSRDMGVLVPSTLYPYFALYIDTSQGREQAIFSVEAFYARYLESHNGSPG